jgi:hypothetical protein
MFFRSLLSVFVEILRDRVTVNINGIIFNILTTTIEFSGFRKIPLCFDYCFNSFRNDVMHGTFVRTVIYHFIAVTL